MHLRRLNEELEHKALDGTVLIGWYAAPDFFKYAENYEKNIRTALGPMMEIKGAKKIKIGFIVDWSVKADNNRLAPKSLRFYIPAAGWRQYDFARQMKLDMVDNMLVADIATMVEKFSGMLRR